jgi:NAD(P)-dependent dehydrogenase (short-subunit alcohol dehydrogenase family)
MPLSDHIRTALVTGAGSGLGEAFAAMLRTEGVRVWGTARDPARLVSQPDFFPVQLELGDRESVLAAWQRAESESGGIDLLVNNAGAALFGAGAHQAADAWKRQMDVLVHGPVRLAREASRAMLSRRRGTIVNVTSLAVEFPIPYMSAYNAGKSALAAFTASLEAELAGSGVVVIDFRPGDCATGFNRAMHAAGGGPGTDPREVRVWERLEALMRRAPPPARFARDLRRALARRRSGLVRSGGFFQARVAPWGNRLLPARLMRLVRGCYFRSGS